MAKGQKRSNREPKKPKQDKPKAAATRSALGALHERPALPTPAKKKQAAEAATDRHGPSRPG